MSTIGHSNSICQTFGAETQSQLYPLLMLFVTNNFHITLIFHKSEQSHLVTSHQGHPVFKFIQVDLKSSKCSIDDNVFKSLKFVDKDVN